MNDVRAALKKLVDKKGLPYVAQLLGENTTRNIENWIRKGNKVPSFRRGMIKKIIEKEPELN